MGIRRACSYKVTFHTPEPPTNYSEILVTFSQKSQVLINKLKINLLVEDNAVIAQLTQEETSLFTAGTPADIQIRCFGGIYNAPGSSVKTVEVWPVLNDTILGGE